MNYNHSLSAWFRFLSALFQFHHCKPSTASHLDYQGNDRRQYFGEDYETPCKNRGVELCYPLGANDGNAAGDLR
jgi:hypothetical protein